MVRRMVGTRAEVHEERTLRSHLLGVGDHRDRTIGQILGQVVVAIFHARRPIRRRLVRLINELLVLHQIGIPLIGLATQEPVVALETATSGPVPLRRRHVGLVLGAAVPLAEHVGVVAALAEHLRDRGRLERDVPVRSREPGGHLADARHPDRGVVATRQQRRASRRAQGCGVELGVAQSALGEPRHRRHLDRAAERLECAESGVVPHHEQHVRRSLSRLRLRVRLPVRNGVPHVDVDDTLERLGHVFPPTGHGRIERCSTYVRLWSLRSSSMG